MSIELSILSLSPSIHYQLRSTCYTAVRIKNCLNLCNQSSHYEKYERFPLQREAITWTLFAVSKDEWDTKENSGKSMKNALYVLQYACLPACLHKCLGLPGQIPLSYVVPRQILSVLSENKSHPNLYSPKPSIVPARPRTNIPR